MNWIVPFLAAGEPFWTGLQMIGEKTEQAKRNDKARAAQIEEMQRRYGA